MAKVKHTTNRAETTSDEDDLSAAVEAKCTSWGHSETPAFATYESHAIKLYRPEWTIPAGQRDFCWSDEHVADYLNVVVRRYPIGPVLTLGTGSAWSRRYVYDGQQRLYACGATLIREDGRPQRTPRVYFDIRQGRFVAGEITDPDYHLTAREVLSGEWAYGPAKFKLDREACHADRVAVRACASILRHSYTVTVWQINPVAVWRGMDQAAHDEGLAAILSEMLRGLSRGVPLTEEEMAHLTAHASQRAREWV